MKLLSKTALDALIANDLPKDASPNEKIVVGTFDDKGAQVLASFKFKPTNAGAFTWELQAAAKHEWTGDDTVGAKVILRW